MNTEMRNAAIGIAGLGTGAVAALALRKARRPKPVRAVVTIGMAAARSERGMELWLESCEIPKDRLKALLRDLKAEIEAGEIATGERSL